MSLRKIIGGAVIISGIAGGVYFAQEGWKSVESLEPYRKRVEGMERNISELYTEEKREKNYADDSTKRERIMRISSMRKDLEREMEKIKEEARWDENQDKIEIEMSKAFFCLATSVLGAGIALGKKDKER